MKRKFFLFIAISQAYVAIASQPSAGVIEQKIDVLAMALLACFMLVALAIIFLYRPPVNDDLKQMESQLEDIQRRLTSLTEKDDGRLIGEQIAELGTRLDPHDLGKKMDEALRRIQNLEKRLRGGRDAVAYNAAVDEWIELNKRLFDLGKDRWKIQNVYRYLAGEDVTRDEMQQELSCLEGPKRERVTVIISDIERFMNVHRKAIDEWLSEEEGNIKTFCDAVRMPQGRTFDAQLDEEMLGEAVDPSAKITKVASLGYFFPNSRNGGYRQKTKVLCG